MTWFTSLFLCGFFAGALLPELRTHAFTLSAAGALLAVLAVAMRRQVLPWQLSSAGSWLAFSALLGTTASPPTLSEFVPGVALIDVETWRTSCGEVDCSVEASLVRCQAQAPATCPADGTLLAVQLTDEPVLGARLRFRAQLSVRPMFNNPAPSITWPDTRPRVRARLADGAIEALSRPWPGRVVAGLRESVRAAFAGSLHAPHAGIARALLLGEAAAVESELNTAIRRSGVSHVLAVSGMHVTVLVGALVLAARFLMRRTPWAARLDAGRVSAWLGVGLAPLVAWVCGGSPSAVRAALTSTLMFLFQAVGRRPNALAVAAAAVVGYGLVSPRDAIHPGFVLSVLATAALLASGHGAATGVRAALFESLRAWAATFPMLAVCFGETSLVALIANVILLPVGALLIPLAVLQLWAAWLGLAGALGTSTAFEWTSGAFIGASRACASVDPGLLTPGLAPWSALGLCIGCFCALFTRGRARALGLLAGGSLALAAEWQLRHRLARDELRVTFFDVGQGDAALLEFGTGENVLIDGGGLDRGVDPGERVLLPALRARRIHALDLVVLSHAHPDHYGGLRAVMAALPVRELWEPGQIGAEDPDGPGAADIARLLAVAQKQGTRVLTAPALCGAPRKLGSAMFFVHSPCPAHDPTWEPNDNSLVVRVQHGERSFLFPGDVEQLAEAALVARSASFRSDVLKVPHHGSRTSSTADFLARVKPRLALVSAGFANRFGHPHAEVEARLRAAIPRVFVTARSGGLEVSSDGRSLRAWSADGSLRGDAL